MNGAEIHLMLNHVPVLGTLFVAGLLVYGLARGQDAVVRVALWAMVVVGLVGVATYLSGEAAEEVVEEALDVSHDVIESHEHFAVWGLVATGIATLGAMAGLFIYRFRPIGRGFSILVLVLTIGAFGTLAYTAYLGGRINHPEIRSGGPTTDGEGEHDVLGEDSSSVPLRLEKTLAFDVAGGSFPG